MKCNQMKDALDYTEKMKEEIFRNVCYSIKNFKDRSKQQLLCNMIRYVDFLFEKDTTYSHNISCKTANLIEYGVPSFLQFVVLDDKNIMGAPLIPSTLCMKNDIEAMLDELEIYGLIETCQKYIKSGLLEFKAISNNQLDLAFTNTYNDLERIDKFSKSMYSNSLLYTLMPHIATVMDETKIAPILAKMDKLLFKWNEDFIGYGADEEVDDFFIHGAVVDLIQEADWNCFEQKDCFGGIEYEVFVGAVLLLESISLKHAQFVHIALNKYPMIDKYNILPVFETKQNVCETFQYMLDIDKAAASYVFDVLSLKQSEIRLYKDAYLPMPPFIEIAKDYFIRSYAGCLFEPMDFLLFKLKKKYPKHWDKNIQKREKHFRQELYELFPDKLYLKLDRNIVLKNKDKIITDIDACLYDIADGNILFVQLKWQDTIYDSFNSMLSKKKNYIEKVNEWIKSVWDWIQLSDVGTIADYLQVSPDMVNKKKIFLLVVGRHNASYSSSGNVFANAESCQWFELQRIIMKNMSDMIEGKYKFSHFINDIRGLRKKKERKRTIKSGIKYNEKKIVYDGLFYNEA